MKKHIIRLLLMILLPHYTYAFFNLKLDFSGLNSISEINKMDLNFTALDNLSNLDEIADIEVFDINLSGLDGLKYINKRNHRSSKHRNNDIPDLKKYYWLETEMLKILTNTENNDSYHKGDTYFQKLDDLNNDTISEIYLSAFSRCNSGVCKYDVYQLVPKTKKLRLIFDSYNTKMHTSDSKQSPWKTLHYAVEHNMTQTTYTYDYNEKNNFYEKIGDK